MYVVTFSISALQAVLILERFDINFLPFENSMQFIAGDFFELLHYWICSARLLPLLSAELQFALQHAQRRGFKSYVSFLLETKVTVLVNEVLCVSHRQGYV